LQGYSLQLISTLGLLPLQMFGSPARLLLPTWGPPSSVMKAGASVEQIASAAPKPMSEHNRLLSSKGSPQCGISIRPMSGWGLLGFQQGMHQLLFQVIPGFTWITWPSFFLGLFWSFVLGWYIAILRVVVFVPLFNLFAARQK
jgi:hypothetical protein